MKTTTIKKIKDYQKDPKEAAIMAYMAAVKAEKEANERRVELEAQVAEFYKNEAKEEGRSTIEDGAYKITINKPVTFKLDDAAYRKVCEKMPEQYQCHRVKLELDKKRFDFMKELAEENATAKTFFKQISNCVEKKIGITSVKIELN